MSISAPFIKRPVATSLLTAAIALTGIVAFRLLPVSPLPEVDFPTISVSRSARGQSRNNGVHGSDPPRTSICAHRGRRRDDIHQHARQQQYHTPVHLDRDINAAARDVQAAINAARGYLPANLPTQSNYRKVNPADAPVLILALTSQVATTAEMYDRASSVFQQKLSQVEGVGQVIVGGSSLPAVRVELNPSVLNKYGIGTDRSERSWAAPTRIVPKGDLQSDSKRSRYERPISCSKRKSTCRSSLRIETARRSASPTRRSCRLRRRPSQRGSANGQPAVLVIVFRQPGANIIDTVDRVRALMPYLQASVPPAMHLSVMVDRTTTIRASIRDVERTLIISIGLVILVVFVFLRNAWATFIPSVSVPLSLIGTFGIMYLLGYSLDNLSLMALTISTGFVVDDAIVVIENIARYLEHGMKPVRGSTSGFAEIGFTVLSMSMSLIAVFIPILLMGGIVGRLFREFAVTFSVALIVSLAISLTTTPMLWRAFCPTIRSRNTAGSTTSANVSSPGSSIRTRLLSALF